VRDIPVEHIAGVVRLFVDHFLGVGPNARLNEVNTHLLLPFVLNCKPNIAFVIDFVDEFEQRPTFEQFVAQLILDVSEHFKKLSISYSWVAKYISQRISERGFEFQQWFQSHFIDVFETVPIQI